MQEGSIERETTPSELVSIDNFLTDKFIDMILQLLKNKINKKSFFHVLPLTNMKTKLLSQ